MRLDDVMAKLQTSVTVGFAEIIDLIKFIFGVIVLWLAWSSFAFATYFIPSESMQPTLEVGDRIVVSKWAYGFSRHTLPMGFGDLLPDDWDGRLGWSSPERGDVVVIRDSEQRINLIKRVTGLPGDVIEMRAGRLYINGDQVNREFVESRRYRQHRGFPGVVAVSFYVEDLPGGGSHWIYERGDDAQLDDFGPETVPPGRVFLMGDNRDNSQDSRAKLGPGFVPFSNIVGRAETVPFTLERCRREDGLYCPSGRVWQGL